MISAIVDVEQAGIGARVLRVQADDDWLTASEIAERVEAWFERYEPETVPAHRPRLSPDFLAEVNDRLDLRERLRHSPHAPWRPKLNEALPLGA